jgi:hypothetical protein
LAFNENDAVIVAALLSEVAGTKARSGASSTRYAQLRQRLDMPAAVDENPQD